MEPIIDTIYEAAVVPESWPAALQTISDRCLAVGGLLFANRLDGSAWITSQGLESVMSSFISDGWINRNERAVRLIAKKHLGFVTDQELFSTREIETIPIYAEFLHPRGLIAGAATAIAGAAGDDLAFTFEGFPDDEAARSALPLLDLLRPHLARAALISSRLHLEQIRSAVTALELVGIPAAIVTSSGRILGANTAMEAHFSSMLQAAWSQLNMGGGRINRLIVESLEAMERGHSHGISLPLRGDDVTSPSVLHVIPIRRAARDIFTGATALLTVTYAGVRSAPNAHLLEQLFDLTPAEARLTQLLLGGASLDVVAQKSNVSIHTVRNQLKNVFLKTGVSRQADLISWVGNLSLPQIITREEPLTDKWSAPRGDPT